MPNKTQELGLNLAVDNDDAADYETVYLSDSLTTVDGLFNQVTGHTHSGAHQGGPINGNAFSGSLDIPDWFRSTGQRSAFASQGAGLEMFWSGTAGVLQSYDRGGSAYRQLNLIGTPLVMQIGASNGFIFDSSRNFTCYLPDGTTRAWAMRPTTNNAIGFELVNSAYTAVTFSVSDSGNVIIPGTLSVVGLSVSGNTTFNGPVGLNNDVNVNTHRLNNCGQITFAGTANITGSGTTVVANNNLSVNGNGSFAGTLTINGLGVVTTGSGSMAHVEYGHPSLNGVGANSPGSYGQTFARAFTTNPIVLVTVDTPTSGDIKDWHVAAQNVSTTGFNVRIFNTTGSGGNCTVHWLAIGN